MDKTKSIKAFGAGAVAVFLVAGVALGADAILKPAAPSRTVTLTASETLAPVPLVEATETPDVEEVETAEPTETPEPAKPAQPKTVAKDTTTPAQATDDDKDDGDVEDADDGEAEDQDDGDVENGGNGQSGHDDGDANDDGDNGGGDD